MGGEPAARRAARPVRPVYNPGRPGHHNSIPTPHLWLRFAHFGGARPGLRGENGDVRAGMTLQGMIGGIVEVIGVCKAWGVLGPIR